MSSSVAELEQIKTENATLRAELARLHRRVAELEARLDERSDAAASDAAASVGAPHPSHHPTQPRCRHLIENFPNGMLVLFDHDLRYVIAGGHGLADIGLTASTIEGKTIWEIFPPEISQGMATSYRAALRGTPTSYDVCISQRSYRIYVLPVKDAQGTIIAGMVMTQEVTTYRERQVNGTHIPAAG